MNTRILAGLCLLLAGGAHAAPCPKGLWADFMLGSHHIHPDHAFQEFNPGIGVECYFKPEWAAAAGYFRNSVDRPSFYGGVFYTPEYAHWGALRAGVVGGVISGYNFGRYGIGANNRTGPILAPLVITRVGRVAVNFFLIPPIPADRLPFTVGFQAKFLLR